MTDLYSELKKLDGRKCFTLTRNYPATMHVDDEGVTIEYASGNSRKMPRSMIVEAMRLLQSQGILTLEDVHYRITNENGPQTDRLMAVLRELPGVTFSAEPRVLYLKK